MTKISEQEITCPECQSAHQFKTYDSANVTLNPSLKEKVLIFDLGLDDRALELLKSSVRASQQEKDLKDGLLIFRGLVKDDEGQLQVIMTNYWGETESSVAIPYVLYETASESLLDIKAEDATAAGIWQRVDERYTFKGAGEAKTTK